MLTQTNHALQRKLQESQGQYAAAMQVAQQAQQKVSQHQVVQDEMQRRYAMMEEQLRQLKSYIEVQSSKSTGPKSFPTSTDGSKGGDKGVPALREPHHSRGGPQSSSHDHDKGVGVGDFDSCVPHQSQL